MEHGSRRVEDWVTRICNSVRNHLYRQAKVEFVEKVFNPSGP
jgi:hypothetical protein